jgi:transcriptional regulator with XRE-family HTH domain
LQGETVPSMMATMPSLQQLLRDRAGIESAQRLADDLGLSRQHASGLWNGRDPLGLRLMRRIKETYGISLDELAEVDEAVKGEPRQRKPKPPIS